VREGNFKDGFAALTAALPLPSILAHICDHPCECKCRRNEAGGAVHIHRLEKSCFHYGHHVIAKKPFMKRNPRVLIAGGELSAVSAAILLAQKGYSTTLCTPAPQLLESLRGLGEEILPASAIASDLAVLDSLPIEVFTSNNILSEVSHGNLEPLREGYNAVFIEAGLWPDEQKADPLTLATQYAGIFAGLAWQELSPIRAVAEGSMAAVSIDRFLQGASLDANRDGEGSQTSKLYVNTAGIAPAKAIEPASAATGYTQEEAKAEGARCFPCSCMECVKRCEFLQKFKSYPKRYVREIYNNECIVMGVRKANRMVNSCALCGLCEAVCPEHLSMGDVCLDARHGMVEKHRMPPSAHDFALRDMAFSTSEAFALVRNEPGHNSSAYAFLPGCQLPASSPEQVAACYEHLRATKDNGVGLILGCCGAPAQWAGDEKLYAETQQTLINAWEQLGRPTLITACSSCYRALRESQPQLPIEPLWQHIDLKQTAAAKTTLQLAVHDPCSTRKYPAVEESARKLLAQLGVETTELNERGLSTCCGYGGLMQFVDKNLAARTVQKRAGQSPLDYVTYCAMCRDRFAQQGKRAIHLLDLIFPAAPAGEAAARPDPGFSVRRENRARLKMNLLEEVWGEETAQVNEPLQVEIGDALLKLLEDRMILVEDVRKTIAHAEESGEKLVLPDNGHILASWRPACVNYWVEYSQDAEKFVLHNAYSHRMQVK
jgi:Fe-S oxidoreductase